MILEDSSLKSIFLDRRPITLFLIVKEKDEIIYTGVFSEL